MNAAGLFDLSSRVAVVTGGGTGIGRAAAEALLSAGAAVVIVGRREDVLRTAAEELGCTYRVADVAEPEAVEALFRGVMEEHGRVDVLVTAAGINTRARALDFQAAEWDSVVNVNARGTFLCCQAAARAMREREYGKIITIGSLASEIGLPGIPAYMASKGAVRQLSRGLAVEWARFGIRVNCIEPGWFRTALNDDLFRNEKWLNAITPRIPLGRTGTMADLQGTILYLASPMSDYVTGALIPVDGGVLAA